MLLKDLPASKTAAKHMEGTQKEVRKLAKRRNMSKNESGDERHSPNTCSHRQNRWVASSRDNNSKCGPMATANPSAPNYDREELESHSLSSRPAGFEEGKS